MTATLSDIRAKVRKDLRDATSADWSDDQIDRGVALAVAEYGRHVPLEKTATATVTGRDVDLSTALGADYGQLVAVVLAEYPMDRWPREAVLFDKWGSQLTLHVDSALDAEDVRVWYELSHTLTASVSTIPDGDAELIALGAAGYALQQLGAGDVQTIPLHGDAPATLDKLGYYRLQGFREGCQRAANRRRGMRVSSLYRADEDRPLSRFKVQPP
jgi:hypothetical protein